MSAHALPPFSSLLKSREVEDPVNLWFNRPLAYAFVALVYRTPITPNQVTLLATAVGLAAAGCVLWGTAQGMLLAGILLWSSAILDGADGILARAKKMQSDLGRALDGTADLVVAAAALVAAAHHLWVKHHSVGQMAIVAVASVTTVFHIYLYDYYKESYLAFTKVGFSGRFESRSDAVNKLEQARAKGAPWVERVAAKLYVDLLSNQYLVVRRSNPAGLREDLQFSVGPEVEASYRRNNRLAMQLWTWISLAPHTYLMAIFMMLDQLDVYLWIRMVGANALFALALLTQRSGSQRTLRDLGERGLAPTPV